MRFWLRIGISFLLIFISLAIIWLIKIQEVTISSTGNFVLTISWAGSIVFATGLFLLTLYQLKKEVKRKTERLTQDDISKRLEEGLAEVKPEYIEANVITRAGSIASYLKKRGIARGRLTERGTYLTYENWAQATKTTVEDILKKYPNLRKESYLLDLLSRIDIFYLSELMERFSYFYEVSRKQGFPYLQKRHLRVLASLMEKYVKG